MAGPKSTQIMAFGNNYCIAFSAESCINMSGYTPGLETNPTIQTLGSNVPQLLIIYTRNPAPGPWLHAWGSIL